MKLILVTLCVILATAAAYEQSDIISARIETCRGCSLNRLPEVKRFVMDDAPFYERLQVKFISGAPPELVLLGNDDRELERILLSELSRQECNELVQARGFTKKKDNKEL
ncbi:unnamed protein product [Arctia plantaginis]|uniref:Selenoprotein M n=1 Tax=Arctia plantaginis TaxID=874455 RepID=A0A8S0ZMX1_ARCPL|nr:unnamed protein product [Arctia plantaginis]CAB3252126.1 unnamed protein product [Arctia plantaginis]